MQTSQFVESEEVEFPRFLKIILAFLAIRGVFLAGLKFIEFNYNAYLAIESIFLRYTLMSQDILYTVVSLFSIVFVLWNFGTKKSNSKNLLILLISSLAVERLFLVFNPAFTMDVANLKSSIIGNLLFMIVSIGAVVYLLKSTEINELFPEKMFQRKNTGYALLFFYPLVSVFVSSFIVVIYTIITTA